jgi:hypothetical protein
VTDRLKVFEIRKVPTFCSHREINNLCHTASPRSVLAMPTVVLTVYYPLLDHKVRNSHWEQLLKAVPKIEHRSHSIEEFLSKPVPKKVAGRHSVY